MVKSVLAVTELIEQRGSQITEFLSIHPNLASPIRSILPLDRYDRALPAARTPSPSGRGPIYEASLNPNHDSTAEPEPRGAVYKDPLLGFNCAAARRSPQNPRVRSNSRLTQSDSGMDEEPTQASRKGRMADLGYFVGEKKAKNTTSRGQYERAVAKAVEAVNEIGSTEILRRIRRWICKERESKSVSLQVVSSTIPEYRGASKQDIIAHLKVLQANFASVKADGHMKVLMKRYKYVLTAMHYNYCNEAKEARSGSLCALFTEVFFPDWVEQRELGIMKVKDLEISKRNKWRDEIRAYRAWLQFEERYGFAMLAVLPEDLANEQ